MSDFYETRDAAHAAAHGCPRCGGEGLATVWHPRPAWARENRRPEHVAAYCVCAHGRWIRGNHAEHNPDMLKRIPDLEEVLAGRSGWRATDPTAPAEPRPLLTVRHS